MNIAKPQLEAYLAGSLNASGLVYGPADPGRALTVYRAILANGMSHLPFFLVSDLLLLLSQGHEVIFRSETPFESDAPFDPKLVTRYERECLGRILNSSDVQAAMEIASTSADPEKVRERLLHQILRLLSPCFPSEFMLNPGLLRDFAFRVPLHPPDHQVFFLEPLVERFLASLNAEINWSRLLQDEDLFELAHFEALSTAHLRVGCRQILEVNRCLREGEPPRIDLKRHEDEADTAFLDETHYPTGGLAGLTNRGSFENLLTSELVYLDEGAGDISLFELRLIEGELLFYLRDSGNLRRRRRTFHFVLDAAPVFESKLPGYRWQYSMLLQGFCLRLLHDLFRLFESDALRFHFHYINPKSAPAEQKEFFQGEIGVMKTVLSDYVKHGWVTFASVDSIQLPALIDPKRKSYAVILASPPSLDGWRDQTAALEQGELALHYALMGVNTTGSPDGELSLPPAGLNDEELRRLRDEVLQSLVN